MKFLSIITINYNDHLGLQKTINSVAPVKSDDIEYIVVDGGSSDGSQTVIKNNIQYIDHQLSESDEGIADAFNKGIRLACGEYLMFLNAGDVLTDGAVDTIREKILIDNKQSLIYIGKVELIYQHKNVTAGARVSKYRQLLRNYLPHQAMVISAACFEEFGVYDERYRLGMDYEWSLRLLQEWSRLTFWDNTLALMDTNGVSMSNFSETFAAYHRARMKHRIINPLLSRLISLFFVIKRSVGIKVRLMCQ